MDIKIIHFVEKKHFLFCFFLSGLNAWGISFVTFFLTTCWVNISTQIVYKWDQLLRIPVSQMIRRLRPKNLQWVEVVPSRMQSRSKAYGEKEQVQYSSSCHHNGEHEISHIWDGQAWSADEDTSGVSAMRYYVFRWGMTPDSTITFSFQAAAVECLLTTNGVILDMLLWHQMWSCNFLSILSTERVCQCYYGNSVSWCWCWVWCHQFSCC